MNLDIHKYIYIIFSALLSPLAPPIYTDYMIGKDEI